VDACLQRPLPSPSLRHVLAVQSWKIRACIHGRFGHYLFSPYLLLIRPRSPSIEPICYTMYYYTDPSDESPLSGFGCYTEATILNIYEKTTASGAAPISSATSSARVAGSSLPSVPSTEVIQPAQTDNASPGSSQSHAWIAGVVIGSVIGVAILAGIIVFIWYLLKRVGQNQATNATIQQKQYLPTALQYPQPMPSMMQPVQLPAVSPISELAGNRGAELPGDS
jgi:hypothetical protein